VNSDTWSTELGVFSPIPPRLIKNFKVVPPGSSGGITWFGLAAGLLGSFVIALGGWLAAPGEWSLTIFNPFFWIVVISGFTANIIDSILGATVQAQYRCPECNKITERRNHCKDTITHLISGSAWLNNDWVNAFCSFSGAFLAWAGVKIFV
jgi:uncharacterized membrane protein